MWVLAALPVLVVVAVDPGAWSPYGPAKWAVTSVTATAGAGWMIAAGRVRLARRPAVAGAALLVVVAMAAAFGRDPLLAWIGTTERHFGALTWLLLMLVFVAGQGLRDEAERRVVQLGFVVAGAALGLFGTVELAGWQVVDLDAVLGPHHRSVRLGGPARRGDVPARAGVRRDRRRRRAPTLVADRGRGGDRPRRDQPRRVGDESGLGGRARRRRRRARRSAAPYGGRRPNGTAPYGGRRPNGTAKAPPDAVRGPPSSP